MVIHNLDTHSGSIFDSGAPSNQYDHILHMYVVAGLVCLKDQQLEVVVVLRQPSHVHATEFR